jgi:hypothetical protein
MSARAGRTIAACPGPEASGARRRGGMMARDMKRKVFALALFFILCAMAGGCARPRSLEELNDDELDTGRGFESVVMWRVTVLDRTGTIHSNPLFSLSRPGLSPRGERNFDGPIPERSAVSGTWTKQDGLSAFDAMAVVAARPGEYLFKDASFYLYTDYVPNYYTGGSEERDVDLSIPLYRLCAVPPGKLLYLGEISIEILKAERNRYTYKVRFIQESNASNDAGKRFHETYPGLYRRFNKTVDTASWKVFFIENFTSNGNGWAVPSGDKRVDAEFGRGKYIMRSGNDECHVSGIVPVFDKPRDFDIELVSTSRTTGVSRGRGLALGSGPDNAYHFLVSGAGEANIELSKDGEHQALPAPGTGVGIANAVRQRLEARGDTIRYFVNDRYAGEIKNELDGKDWFVGLEVCGKQTVEFDQLTLIEQ